MKKKIFGLFAIVIIAIVAAFNVNLVVKDNGESSLALANIEALAQYEYTPKERIGLCSTDFTTFYERMPCSLYSPNSFAEYTYYDYFCIDGTSEGCMSGSTVEECTCDGDINEYYRLEEYSCKEKKDKK